MSFIAASILDADYGNIKFEIEDVDHAGVDMFTIDVMDNTFIPRITFGDYVVARIREWTDLPIDVHLMTLNPINWIEKMYNAGADIITFHLESTDSPLDVIERIKSYNLLPGIAVNFETPAYKLFPFLDKIALANLLAVPTGFGGQPLQPKVIEKIEELKGKLTEINANVAIEVDGGVKENNIREVALAGADILTIGTGIYHTEDRLATVSRLKSILLKSITDGENEKFLNLLTPRNLARNRTEEQVKRLKELRDSLDNDPTIWEPRGSVNG